MRLPYHARSYFSIVAAGYQVFHCLIPLGYAITNGAFNFRFQAVYLGQLVISTIFLVLMVRGLKWAYVVFFALNAIHLGELIVETGFARHGYNYLMVALTGFGLFNRIAKEKELRERLP